MGHRASHCCCARARAGEPASGRKIREERLNLEVNLKPFARKFQHKAQLIGRASRKTAGTDCPVDFIMQMMRMSGKTRMVRRIVEPVKAAGLPSSLPMVRIFSGGAQPNVYETCVAQRQAQLERALATLSQKHGGAQNIAKFSPRNPFKGAIIGRQGLVQFLERFLKGVEVRFQIFPSDQIFPSRVTGDFIGLDLAQERMARRSQIFFPEICNVFLG